MSRDYKTFLVRLAALGAAACSSVYATRPAPGHEPPQAIAPVPTPATSPYQVDLISSSGQTLDTYNRGNRFYVLGQSGERYSIRVKNPTASRIEAVISVDGLDVIDGRDADFASKRGYVVQPHSEVVVDGFRTSTSHVAAFRFSSVADSYAERKGKGRNVGVIGVAIFAEKERPQVIMPSPPPHPHPYHRGGGHYDLDQEAGEAAPSDDASGATGGSAAPSKSTSRRHSDSVITQRERPGLGTQWGESRHSAVRFTTFERAHPTKPTATATLRYNDRAGLQALGIRLVPEPDSHELHLRETADPFPGHGFATPPPR